MKRVIKGGIITATIIAVAGMVVFYACKKDDGFNTTRTQDTKLMGSIGATTTDFNWVSDAFLNAFETTLNDFGFGEGSNPDICGEQMKAIVQQAIESNGYSWLYNENNTIASNEIEYTKMIYQIFIQVPHENLNNNIDNLLNEIISSSMQDEQKMRLCIFGKSIIGMNNISDAIASKIANGEIVIKDDDGIKYTETRWDRQWDECMKVRLEAIFGDNNPFDIGLFVVSSPAQILWMSAACAWDIWKGKYDYIKDLPPVVDTLPY